MHSAVSAALTEFYFGTLSETRSKNFFSVLHGYTSWVLKAWANRLFERQIVGPPPVRPTAKRAASGQDAEMTDARAALSAVPPVLQLASRVPGTETISIDQVLHDVTIGRWIAPDNATVGSLPPRCG